jgi:hypothetical protein
MLKMIKKIKNFLDNEQKQFISKTVLGPNFPFYLNDHTVGKGNKAEDPNNYFFSHNIILRPENRNPDILFNSEYHPFFINLVKKVFTKLKIKPKEFYRMSLNLTYPNGIIKCPRHVDHSYKHKTLILYLNDCDKKACTYIEEKNKTKEIKPIFNTGVFFDDNVHYMKNPTTGLRLVLVTTFI